jgi:hypothetical protein
MSVRGRRPRSIPHRRAGVSKKSISMIRLPARHANHAGETNIGQVGSTAGVEGLAMSGSTGWKRRGWRYYGEGRGCGSRRNLPARDLRGTTRSLRRFTPRRASRAAHGSAMTRSTFPITMRNGAPGATTGRSMNCTDGFQAGRRITILRKREAFRPPSIVST